MIPALGKKNKNINPTIYGIVIGSWFWILKILLFFLDFGFGSVKLILWRFGCWKNARNHFFNNENNHAAKKILNLFSILGVTKLALTLSFEGINWVFFCSFEVLLFYIRPTNRWTVKGTLKIIVLVMSIQNWSFVNPRNLTNLQNNKTVDDYDLEKNWFPSKEIWW